VKLCLHAKWTGEKRTKIYLAPTYQSCWAQKRMRIKVPLSGWMMVPMGMRVLHQGPNKHGYTARTCWMACRLSKYIALHDGGKCTCGSNMKHLRSFLLVDDDKCDSAAPESELAANWGSAGRGLLGMGKSVVGVILPRRRRRTPTPAPTAARILGKGQGQTTTTAIYSTTPSILPNVITQGDGWCESSTGDQNTGVLRLFPDKVSMAGMHSVWLAPAIIKTLHAHAKTMATHQAWQKCLSKCKEILGATGCEVVMAWQNAGCFVHTAEVTKVRTAKDHKCWVFAASPAADGSTFAPDVRSHGDGTNFKINHGADEDAECLQNEPGAPDIGDKQPTEEKPGYFGSKKIVDQDDKELPGVFNTCNQYTRTYTKKIYKKNKCVDQPATGPCKKFNYDINPTVEVNKGKCTQHVCGETGAHGGATVVEDCKPCEQKPDEEVQLQLDANAEEALLIQSLKL